MANEKNGNGKAKWVTITITLVVLGATIVATWATGTLEQKVTREKVVELKKEGCKPAQGHRTSIALIEQRLDTIDVTQSEMRLENKECFKAVMKKLEEK